MPAAATSGSASTISTCRACRSAAGRIRRRRRCPPIRSTTPGRRRLGRHRAQLRRGRAGRYRRHAVTDGAGDVRVITLGAADPDGTVTFNGGQVSHQPRQQPRRQHCLRRGRCGWRRRRQCRQRLRRHRVRRRPTSDRSHRCHLRHPGRRAHLAAGWHQSGDGGCRDCHRRQWILIQAATGDGNAATSDAIFVFTGGAPGVTLGHLVKVTGTVTEFTDASAAPGSLSITELTSPVVDDLGVGRPSPRRRSAARPG